MLVALRSYHQLAEGRNEFGVPILGRVPYVSRGFRNVGNGRSAVSVRIGVAVRVIDLREEEFRQTGLRSR
jgi:general secretion pathway protein D